MKKSLFLMAAIFAVASVSAQDKITIEGLQAFNTLKVDGKIELTATFDPSQPLAKVIELNGNDPNKVKWGVDKKGVLSIAFAGSKKDLPVKVTLNCHSIGLLQLSGASMTTDPELPWRDKIVTIVLDKGAKLTADADFADLKLTAGGSSAAVISGTGIYADFYSSGKSTIDARNYSTRSVTLSTGGGSESYVFGSDRIAISAPGSSSVFYRGNPMILRIDAAKSANINPIGR